MVSMGVESGVGCGREFIVPDSNLIWDHRLQKFIKRIDDKRRDFSFDPDSVAYVPLKDLPKRRRMVDLDHELDASRYGLKNELEYESRKARDAQSRARRFGSWDLVLQKPVREDPIDRNDVDNLLIALGTCQSLEDFLEVV